MGANGQADEIDDENILDRISIIEDDVLLLETELVELLTRLNRISGDLEIIKKYYESRRPQCG